MVTVLDLYSIAEDENILLEWRDLGNLLGIYVFDLELTRPYIGLNTFLRNDGDLLKCVLAHELGHHFCTAGQRVIAASATQIYRVAKYEHLATDWAVDKLVPGEMFLELLQKQFTFENMVTFFGVLPEFIIHRAKKIYANGLRIPEIRAICNNSVFQVMV